MLAHFGYKFLQFMARRKFAFLVGERLLRAFPSGKYVNLVGISHAYICSENPHTQDQLAK